MGEFFFTVRGKGEKERRKKSEIDLIAEAINALNFNVLLL